MDIRGVAWDGSAGVTLKAAWDGHGMAATQSHAFHFEVSTTAPLAKLAISELAETKLSRICRVVGACSYARHSPFGFWLEDVRALGFLRPPWALTHEALMQLVWTAQLANGQP